MGSHTNPCGILRPSERQQFPNYDQQHGQRQEVPASTVRRYDVLIDDPDQARPHRYQIYAPSQRAAVYEAARRAILDDERGAGTFLLEATDLRRELWSSWPELVEAVAAYGLVLPYYGPALDDSPEVGRS